MTQLTGGEGWWGGMVARVSTPLAAGLTALQGRLVARDAATVWGPDHPAVRGEQISK
jgi:hypothetical protein